MADVNFEFGAGGGELLKHIQNLTEELSKALRLQEEMKKESKESFQAAAKGADQFGDELTKALKVQMEQKALIETMIKKMAELEDAQKGAYNSSDLNKHVQRVKELEAEIDALKKKYKETGDASKKAMAVASQSMVQYLATLDAAKQKLASLSSGSSEYKKLEAEIQAAELAQSKLTIAVDEHGNAAGGSRAELKAMREALIQLKQAGLDQTDVYNDLKDAAGELADTIGDVNEEFKQAGSDTSGLDKLVRGVELGVNAMGLLEGATVLLGEENEALQETLVRLNALMVISQSLQAVMTELRRADNVVVEAQIALQKVYALVVGNSTGAMKAFRIALAATGIGLLVVGITLLIQKLQEMKRNTELVTSIGKKAADGYAEQKVQMELLTDRVNRGGKTFQDKKEILRDYNKQFGDTIGKAKTYEQAEKNIIDRGPYFILALQYRAKAMAAYQIAVEKAKEMIIEMAKSDEEIYGFGYSIDKFVNGADEMKKIVDKKRKENIAEMNKDFKATIAAQKVYYNAEQNEARKQGFNMSGEQEKIDKKKIDDQRRTNEKLIQLQQQLNQARLELLTDGANKEIQKEIAAYNASIDAFLNQRAETEAELKKAKNKGDQNLLIREIDLIDKNIDAETAAHLARILAIQTNYHDKAKEAFTEADDAIGEVRKNAQALEISETNKHYDELLETIVEARKKASEFNAITESGEFNITPYSNAEQEIEEKRLKEINEINLKYSLQKLDQQEELAAAEAGLIDRAGLTQKKLEELKEIQRLKVIIDYGKKRIALLEKLGGEENKVQLAQLKKGVNDAQNELNELTNNKKSSVNGWISNVLGIDDDTTKEAMQAFGNLIDQVLTAQRQAHQEEMKRIDERIKKINEEVDNQEAIVEKQKKLKEEGYANDYEIENKKLQDLKARQAQETKAKEDAQKKSEQIQKREAIIRAATIAGQTAEQVSNLTTAATKIFDSSSSLPFGAGVVIAIAAIAAMFAGFLAIKNSIKAATTTARDGRRVAKGNRHSGGGNKYVSMDNNDPDILEIEEGEWVVNRESSDMYDPLLEAINSRKKVNASKRELTRMLKPLGIHLQEDLPKNIVEKHNQVNGLVVVVTGADDSKQWEKQNRLLKDLNKPQKTVEYTDTHRIEREGNIVWKIKLK